MMGVYKITNLLNGHCYVGMSRRINKRWIEHRTPKNQKKDTVLARAFRKYGIENFRFEVIEEVQVGAELFGAEKRHIAELKPHYNMNDGGSGNPGHALSEELKAKLSEYGKRQWAAKSEEERLHVINNCLVGPRIKHIVSDETKELLRQRNLGKKQSAEVMRKRSMKMKVAMLCNQNGNKKVLQVLVDRNCFTVIAVHDSTKLAATVVGVHPSNITKVLKCEQQTAGGYYWVLIKEDVL